jgi:hypothetical protein
VSRKQGHSVKVSDGLIATKTAGQVLYLAFGGKADPVPVVKGAV